MRTKVDFLHREDTIEYTCKKKESGIVAVHLKSNKTAYIMFGQV